ncbi:hypothetical protein Lal_00030308 [Lupinus albus]|nr:hypothetical protein Lal_00030308 [Lupinus albus]
MLHQRLLNKAGVKNHALENGKEAIDIHCSAQSFDMILMDKDMPIMNGIEETNKLRSMGIGSMIVGVSSSSKEEEIREFMEKKKILESSQLNQPNTLLNTKHDVTYSSLKSSQHDPSAYRDRDNTVNRPRHDPDTLAKTASHNLDSIGWPADRAV